MVWQRKRNRQVVSRGGNELEVGSPGAHIQNGVIQSGNGPGKDASPFLPRCLSLQAQPAAPGGKSSVQKRLGPAPKCRAHQKSCRLTLVHSVRASHLGSPPRGTPGLVGTRGLGALLSLCSQNRRPLALRVQTLFTVRGRSIGSGSSP